MSSTTNTHRVPPADVELLVVGVMGVDRLIGDLSLDLVIIDVVGSTGRIMSEIGLSIMSLSLDLMISDVVGWCDVGWSQPPADTTPAQRIVLAGAWNDLA